jgi:hypothetical protein
MRTALIVAAAALLTVEAFSQQSARPQPSSLLYGSFAVSPETTGAIHGVVIAQDGRPAKGVLVTVLRLCPDDEACFVVTSNTTTNEAGEYLFEPVTFGNYSVFVGWLVELDPPRFTATPLSEAVELSLDHPEAEVRFEVRPR